MKLPQALDSGATIGVIALAAAIHPAALKRGLHALAASGFRAKVALDPASAYGSNRYLFSSAGANERVAALHGLFLDPEVKLILSARGGYGSLELLPLIDWGLLAANPKPLMGFSDITAVLLAAYRCCPEVLISVHGPSLLSLAEDAEYSELNLKTLSAFLKGRAPSYSGIGGWQHLYGAKDGRGKLMGGNLSLIQSLLGTPWEPNFTGHIVVIEEVGEKPYRIHRQLLQLKYAGKLKDLKGVLLSSFTGCDDSRGAPLREVFRDIFQDADYPVYLGGPFGHQGPLFPLPFGVEAVMSNKGLELIGAFCLT